MQHASLKKTVQTQQHKSQVFSLTPLGARERERERERQREPERGSEKQRETEKQRDRHRE